MQKQRTNRKSVKRLLVLLVLTFLCVSTLVADISVPEAPVEIEIQVSKDKIYVGDSIDVYATITLLKDHPNYVEGNKYRIGERKTYTMVSIGGKLMPVKLDEPPLWEILSSDKDMVLDDNNSYFTFHFKQKLNRMPDRENLYIKVSVSPTPYTSANHGDPFTSQILERIEVTCLDEGLEYKPVIFPEDRKYRGEGSFGPEDFDDSEPLEVDLTPQPSQIKDLKQANPDLFNVELEKAENGDKQHLYKLEGKRVYKVLVNTTLEHDFGVAISNVSCDPGIGTASGNGSVLIFNAASTEGATGNIYFNMDGEYWQMQIELIGDYDTHGN